MSQLSGHVWTARSGLNSAVPTLPERRPHMGETDLSRIRQEPLFRELVEQRTRFAWTLSAAMLVIYFGFILIIAFAPKVLAVPIAGGVMTLGIPVGLFVIVSAFVLTGIYVQRANSRFDSLTHDIMEKVK